MYVWVGVCVCVRTQGGGRWVAFVQVGSRRMSGLNLNTSQTAATNNAGNQSAREKREHMSWFPSVSHTHTQG